MDREPIAKIKSICSVDREHPDFGKLNVNWYYYKDEIDFTNKKVKVLADGSPLTPFQLEAIAEHELFLSNHTDKVWVQSIQSRVNIRNL